MTTFRKVADGFYVAPQLEPDDFAEAAAMGIKTIINNRPDGEAPDQLSAAEARAAAEAHGMVCVHVPVVSGGLQPEDVTAMRQAIGSHAGPFVAYCRSGTRSCHVWALATAAREDPDALIQAAARAGYDLHAMRPLLQRLHGEGGG